MKEVVELLYFSEIDEAKSMKDHDHDHDGISVD